MGGVTISLPPYRPPQQDNPLEQYSRVVQLRNLMQAGGQDAQLRQQQIQSNQMGLQQQQQQMEDQNKLRKIYMDAGGNLDKVVKAASQAGIDPMVVQKINEANLKQKTDLMSYDKDRQSFALAQANLLQGAHDKVMAANPQARPQVYAQQLSGLKQAGLDVSQFPPQLPPDPAQQEQMIQFFGASLQGHKEQMEEAFKSAETKKNLAQAEEASQGRLPTEASLAMRAAQGDATASAALNQLSKTKRESKVIINQPNTARSDRSYQYESGRLDKAQEPIQQAVARLGRLQDTINQNSPQADALVAPELLTVMAGGQGSGLRMNEAEISRIVGGRSQWESLRAAAQKWSADPSTANSITASQRQQIRALVGEVQRKLLAKQQIIENARQALVGSDDPSQHRQITAKARADLSGVDSAGAAAVTVTAPNGKTYTFPDQQSADMFKKRAGIK